MVHFWLFAKWLLKPGLEGKPNWGVRFFRREGWKKNDCSKFSERVLINFNSKKTLYVQLWKGVLVQVHERLDVVHAKKRNTGAIRLWGLKSRNQCRKTVCSKVSPRNLENLSKYLMGAGWRNKALRNHEQDLPKGDVAMQLHSSMGFQCTGVSLERERTLSFFGWQGNLKVTARGGNNY